MHLQFKEYDVNGRLLFVTCSGLDVSPLDGRNDYVEPRFPRHARSRCVLFARDETRNLEGVSLQLPELAEIKELGKDLPANLELVSTPSQTSIRAVSVVSYLRFGLATDPLSLILVTDILKHIPHSPCLLHDASISAFLIS
jgi:hypothetical protein